MLIKAHDGVKVSQHTQYQRGTEAASGIRPSLNKNMNLSVIVFSFPTSLVILSTFVQ